MALTRVAEVNKLFLEQLNEYRHGFKVLDVTSLDDIKTCDYDSDGEEEKGEKDSAQDTKTDRRKKREKHRALNLTKYLQYITAAD